MSFSPLLLILFVTANCVAFNFDANKSVVHRPSFARGSNFGQTVAGYKVSAAGAWLIVGAPLAARDRYHNGRWVQSREGAVYRCRIDRPNSCYLLPFDTKEDWSEARDHYGAYKSENRTGQLLGATLQVAGDVVMACAPNYRHVARVLRQDEFREEPTGLCLVLRDQFRKFEEHSPCKNSLWGHHRQGYCQAGFSAAISANDSSLFIGGPGAWYWQGMVFSISLYNKDVQHRFPDRSGESKFDDSYRGYAIYTGHFDNDIYEDVLISAPRGADLKGSVEIFSSRFRLLHTFRGTQMGAYFGASLIAVDINNDRHDDIIIGSPMFYDEADPDNYDQGRVDIFVRKQTKHNNEFNFELQTIFGFEAHSRFGATLAKLGDIDDDGFNDVAIAAPYGGQDNSGVVYIFRGSHEGLHSAPAQTLKGFEFGLKTFGHSLSGGLDLDANGYPDLVVGAYESDSAVFVRSRAVVKAWVQSQTTPRIIDLKDPNAYCEPGKKVTCMSFEVCAQYFGKAVPRVLIMQITVELDYEKSQNFSMRRVFFNETGQPVLSHNHTFYFDKQVCFTHMIHIQKTIRDKFNPVQCRVNITMPRFESDRELMPLFNVDEQLTHTHSIRFLRNCGADDICTPDLKLAASSPSLTHVYGSEDNIDLNVKIVNAREDAFEAQCFITLPHGVDYVKAFIDKHTSLPCKHNKSINYDKETTVICDIGNPLVAGASKNFTIRVSPQKILLNQDKLKFNISVTSSNKEGEEAQLDNEKYIYVVMKATPAVALIGKQYQEQVVYETKTSSEQIKSEIDIGPEVIHEYKMMNKGPSQISLSELIVTWQKATADNRHYLYLMEVPYTEGPVKCHVDPSLVNAMNISHVEGDHIVNPEKYYQSGGAKQKRHYTGLDSEYARPTESQPFGYRAANTLLGMQSLSSLDLSSECALNRANTQSYERQVLMNKNNRVLDLAVTSLCGSVFCDVGGLKKDESVLVRLRYRLWSKNLALNPEVYYVKTYAMAAVTEMPYKKIDLNMELLRSSAQIETVAYPKQRGQFLEQIDIHIIFLSVVTGVFLLLILIILLWCCGFFKRFEPQDMKKLEDASMSDEEISNDVIDISKDCNRSQNRPNNHNPLYANHRPPYEDYQQPKAYQHLVDGFQHQVHSIPDKSVNAQLQAMFSNRPDDTQAIYTKVVQQRPDPSIYSRLETAAQRQALRSPGAPTYAEPGIVDHGNNEENTMSTFQKNFHNRSAESPTYSTNEKFYIQNLDGARLLTNSNDFQPSLLNTVAHREMLGKLRNQIEENNSICGSDSGNHRAPLLSPTLSDASECPKPDNFTSKLPPVPRRNSKNTLQNTRNRTMSPLNGKQASNIRFANGQQGQSSSPSHQMLVTNNNINPRNKNNFYEKI